MRPEELHEKIFSEAFAIRTISDEQASSLEALRERIARVGEVREKGQSVVDLVTRICGGRLARYDNMPPGTSSTGAVILDRLTSPDGDSVVVLGRVDVSKPLRDDQTADTDAATRVDISWGFAPETMPVGADTNPERYSGTVEYALDGKPYLVQWLRSESTEDAPLRTYIDPMQQIDMSPLQEMADTALGSLHESLDIIAAAAVRPGLNSTVLEI